MKAISWGLIKDCGVSRRGIRRVRFYCSWKSPCFYGRPMSSPILRPMQYAILGLPVGIFTGFRFEAEFWNILTKIR